MASSGISCANSIDSASLEGGDMTRRHMTEQSKTNKAGRCKKKAVYYVGPQKNGGDLGDPRRDPDFLKSEARKQLLSEFLQVQ